ncbi:MAG TPA: carboxymuconolactone decarboxylase family protein [Myxococcales bacterium]|nr:carboxymuconolactone decarboxylase family protein [Myxococcales bacterium]
MTRRLVVSLAVSLLSLPALAGQSKEAQAAFAQAKQAVGLVPAFLRVLPDPLVAPIWEQVGALEMNPNTALPGKTKELIGMAVAAQIPCHYCGYSHTQFARLEGATETELHEAAAVAALTRHWATVFDAFSAQPAEQAASVPAEVQAIYADIEKTLGAVPPALRRYPQAALAPAWKAFKSASSYTLPAKDRALIGLAVSAQIPSPDCAKFYQEAAKAAGATEPEIEEAVAMAALVRAGSAVLNGALLDEAAYRKEVDQMVKHAKVAMKKEMARR